MIFDLFDYILGIVKLVIYKIFYGRKMKCSVVSKFSGGFQLRLFNKSQFITGKNIVIRSGVKIRCNNTGKVVIGDDVGLNNNCLINSMDSITIGSHTIMGQDVKMYDHDHVYAVQGYRRNSGFKTAPIVIGENVWIGSGCIILKGTTIGDNCVIGAGSIIKGTIEANQVVYCQNELINKEIKLLEE